MARLLKEVYIVHGAKADSINEWNVAQALDKFGVEFEFQYYFGISRTRGSQIIDFLCKTAPKFTPLNVQGTYWHGAGRYAANEAIKESDVNVRMRGIWAPIQLILEPECETIEDAIKVVGERLGIG